MMSGVKVRKIAAKDIPHIVEIQESLTKKEIPKPRPRSIEAHLRKRGEKNMNNLIYRGQKMGYGEAGFLLTGALKSWYKKRK